MNGFAYIGTFQEPVCTTSGVIVVDIDQAIANYPDTTGATVAESTVCPLITCCT
ncbi:MAG: hypothetical protein F6J98_01280 [Moorea sp. SIO4G2]|nr:hypothetical protein [Moorena sp. SIO4G2]